MHKKFVPADLDSLYNKYLVHADNSFIMSYVGRIIVTLFWVTPRYTPVNNLNRIVGYHAYSRLRFGKRPLNAVTTMTTLRSNQEVKGQVSEEAGEIQRSDEKTFFWLEILILNIKHGFGSIGALN